MLNDPNTMPDFKKRKKSSLRQEPLPKYRSAASTFLTPQPKVKKRK
jgi:hypothetical protein